MLRLRPVQARRSVFEFAVRGVPSAGAKLEVIPLFDDPKLELARLLREAANIEHALAVQYLYAGYSVTPRYFDSLAGPPGRNSGALIGIAIEEMFHLSEVNQLLVLIKASPNFERQDFPITTDIYPFDFELERLSKESLAKYLVAESPPGELDPAGAADAAERAFREEVQALLDGGATNQIGSLYRTIKLRLAQAVVAEPGLLADAPYWLGRLQAILEEGELKHYRFFKDVFLGSHPAFGGQSPWDTSSDAYPSLPVARNPSAFEGAPTVIADPTLRKLARLSNIHYWTLLVLLHHGAVLGRKDLVSQAKQHMGDGLHPLARALAAPESGVPFDAMGLNFSLGFDLASSTVLTCDLLREGVALQEELGAALPSIPYRKVLATKTIALLGG